MNPQNEKGKTSSRQYHRPERRQAPHRRPPSTKEAVPNIPGRRQKEVQGRKALPVAQPMRPATRATEGRRKGKGVIVRTTAPAAGESSTQSRSQPRRAQFDVRMALALFGFAVAAVLVILFGLDLSMAVPFDRVSVLMDVTYVFCGIILGWLSWSCLRDLR